MRAVERDHRGGIRHDRPVPGQDAHDRAVAGERADPLERVEVGAELAVGVGDDRGAAAEHGVAGEQGVVGGQRERDRVGRVPRRGDHPQLEAADGQHVTVAQVVVAAARPPAPGCR